MQRLTEGEGNLSWQCTLGGQATDQLDITSERRWCVLQIACVHRKLPVEEHRSNDAGPLLTDRAVEPCDIGRNELDGDPDVAAA